MAVVQLGDTGSAKVRPVTVAESQGVEQHCTLKVERNQGVSPFVGPCPP